MLHLFHVNIGEYADEFFGFYVLCVEVCKLCG
ncbi:UNVERIFIED_CONTAM: hypothetical protein C7454_11091 [Acidovorax defluvii]